MRSILIVGNFLSSSLGTRSVCEDFAERLKSSGWSVITASSKKGRVARISDIISTIWQKRNQFEIAQVDVYSGNAFFWAEAACWTLRHAGKPYVLTLHGGNLPEFSNKWPTRVGRLLNSAAAATCPSPFLLEKLRNFRNDLVLLPNPLEVNLFPFVHRENPKPNLIWLRAFHEIYNPELAPKVIDALRKIFPDVRLKMGGPVKEESSFIKMKKVANELGVEDRIEVCGAISRENIASFLNQGDIFLNTTYFDNTPVSLMEAMACGLCIVSTEVGGIPYFLKDGYDALLVPSNDAESMSAAVVRILNE
ncbi:glycosyltransferase family 4 protein, partial [bacterium]|nr:glycosyltransferase family 4 protein [bacterium]